MSKNILKRYIEQKHTHTSFQALTIERSRNAMPVSEKQIQAISESIKLHPIERMKELELEKARKKMPNSIEVI